jgi:hypothetical protein
VKVADAQVVHYGIDGLPAYADRATPRRAQGKQQRRGESDHGRGRHPGVRGRGVRHHGADAPQVARRLHALLDELESTLPAERQAAIASQRNLLEAAVSAALPAPFASVASVADREGLG